MLREDVRAALPAVVLAGALAGCGRKRAAPPPPPADARPAAALDAAAPRTVDAPTPSHAFVTGTVVVAARAGDHVRPFRLDPATGAWTALGSGDEHLFPSEAADGDALLVVATRGEREDDHVERLAWVRGATVELLAPRAGALRNPARAPSGALVYESSARSFRDLYRLDARGEARLTDDREGNLEPALSPDGKTVAFTSSRDGDAELYRVPTAGGRATRLTASARDDWGARWSPDGRRLAFLSDREGSPRVFVVDADGTELRRLTAETEPTAVEDAPRWSPDGATVALLRTAGGPTAAVLVDGTGRARALTPAGASDSELAWSPDGAYLVVARHQPPGAPAAVTFVRVSDGATVAVEPLEPLAVRWFAPVTGPGSAPRPGG